MVLQKIVVVSKSSDVQQLAQQTGEQVFIADDFSETIDIARTVMPNLILLEYGHNLCAVRDLVAATYNIGLNVPVVVVGGDGNENTAAELKQCGAYDYLPSASDRRALESTAERIAGRLSAEAPASDDDYFAADFAKAVGLVGKSKAIRNTLRMLKLVADSNCNPVLIVGETGTGKELAAKAVHLLRHQDEQFVAINCAALTANLLESEMFGHVKGSFTGADRDKTGLLELAEHGTIFLDEISEMPLELQAKLLRVLQEKMFRKVGGITDLVCTATIIASSNRDLGREVQANRFRRDLYYRLNICPIVIPPLCSPDRRQDVRLLADYFLGASTVCPAKTQQITGITAMAMESLENHCWPGNVRELRNVVDRAILLETTDKIGLSSVIIDHTALIDAPPAEAGIQMRDFSLDKAERQLIARALQETGWQKTRAASLLGITRTTLYAKVKQHNIHRDCCSSCGEQSRTSQTEDAIDAESLPQHVPAA